MTDNILIVEDDRTLRETLDYRLTREGYAVVAAGDGPAGLEAARRQHPDLIILDIMLPGLDGFEVCRILRQEMNAPIIMLTARDQEIDKVVGLEVGADDYLTKPFSMRELLARIKAQLRRVRLTREEAIAGGEPVAAPELPAATPGLVFGDLSIDQSRRQVLLRGEALKLKPKEFDLLLFLARNRGIVLSRDMILERVWGWEYDGGTRTVDVHIRWLREKIEEDPARPARLTTLRGTGYRFEG